MFNNNSAQIVAQQGYRSNQSTAHNLQQSSGSNIFQNSNTGQNSGSQGSNFIQQNISQRGNYSYLHEQELLKTLNRIAQFGKGDDTTKLIAILEKIFESTEGIFKRACRQSQSIKDKSKDVREDIKSKYAQVKQRNLSILKAMMNLRQKMMSQMFMYKVRSPVMESQLQSITQKITAISMEIKSKLNKYKFAKQLNSHTEKKVVKTVSINAPLVELRAASERLSRQTIKLKEELKICGQMLSKRDF